MSLDTSIIPSNSSQTRSGTGGQLARPAKANGFDAKQCLHALRRRWLLATVLGVIVSASATAGVWFFLPPGQQTAARTFQVAAVAPTVAFDAREKSVDFETFKRGQVGLIKSRIVLNAALRSPKVANLAILSEIPQPMEWLEKEVKVNFLAGPELMQITLQGSAEQIDEMGKLVDAVAAAYLSEVVDKERDAHQKRLGVVRDMAARYTNKLKNIRLSMRKLRESVGTGDPANVALKQQMALQEYNQVSKDLTKRRSDIRGMRTLLSQMEAGKSEEFTVAPEEIEATLDADPRLTKLREQIRQYSSKLESEAARSAQGYEHPLIKTMQKTLDSKRAELKAERESLRNAQMASLKSGKVRDAKMGLANLKWKLAQEIELEKVETKDRERLSKESNSLNVKALDLEDFKADMDQADTMAQFLNKKAESMAVEEEAPPRIFKHEDEALIIRPDEQVRKMRFAGGAGAGGLALVVALVVFLELQSRRLSSST